MIKRFKSFITKAEAIVIINSALCFITAFIGVKAVIGLARFIIMRHFSAWVHLVNFDLICMNGKDARIWTHTSVISMYSVGVIVAAIMAILSLIAYYKLRKNKGLLKLFAFWFYVISLNQSLGVFLRDIPIKRDFYHALNWMYVPYELMIGLTIFVGVVLLILNGFNYRKALRLTTSTEYIRDNRSRRKTYAKIVMIPAILASMLLILLHFYKIYGYEILELVILIISLSTPYIVFLKGDIPKKIKIFKDEPTNQINSFAVIMGCSAIVVYFVVKFLFF